MAKKFVATWFYAPLSTHSKEEGLIFKEVVKYSNNRLVDLDQFSHLIAEKYEELDENGYDVVNVIPIAMGQSENCTQSDGNYVGDVGFSITRGAVVVGKRRID